MKKPYIQLGVLLLASVYGQYITAADEKRDRTTLATASSSAPRYEPQRVPEPPKDPVERELRAKIGSRFNNSGKARPLDQEPEPGTPPTARMALNNTTLISPLPSAFSTVVALGQIVSVQTYFSEDKTRIYRELAFRLDEVFKSTGRALKTGDSLTILSDGGSLILPSGRVVTFEVRGLGSPLAPGGQYVLFLNEDREISRFKVVTAWQLTAEQVLPIAVFCTPQEREELMSLDPQGFLVRVRRAVQ